MKIAFCGGHITPALACIDYIKTHYPQDQIWLIGRVYSQQDGHQLAHEKELALSRRIQFVPFDGVRWEVGGWRKSLSTSFQLVLSCLQALYILINIKPQVLISFGGYLAVPLAISAWALRIPIVTHEQTRSAGKANILIGHLAKKIAISHQSSEGYFPKKKVVFTGNLLRQAIFVPNSPPPPWLTKIPKAPLLYITGGSQGSQVINSIIKQCLPQLLKTFWIIHQCGKNTESQSYKAELLGSIKKFNLPPSKYHVKEWLTESELSWVLQNTHLAISRAGANTVDELVSAQVPTLFIPLPFTHDEEQVVNAQSIVDVGGALILEQRNLSQSELLKSLKKLFNQADRMRIQLAKIPTCHDSSVKFYQIISSMAK